MHSGIMLVAKLDNGMSETLQFQCTSCGSIVERPRNPRVCPSCGETVMRPVEVSEPGASGNRLQTEDFDLDSALSDLEDMKPSLSEGRQEQERGSDDNQNSDGGESVGRGLFSRFASWFSR